MTIRRRLALSFLIILALFAGNLAVYFWSDGSRSASFETFRQALLRQLSVLELQRDLEDRRKEVAVMAIDTEADASQERIDDLISRLQGTKASTLELLSLSDSDPAIDRIVRRYQELQEQWTLFYRSLQPASEDASAGTTAAAAPAIGGTSEEPSEPQQPLVRAAEILRQLNGHLTLLEASEEVRVQETTAQFYEARDVTNRITLWIFGLSILTAVALALLLSTHLTGRLRILGTGVRRIGEGDLEHRITFRGRDELSVLSDGFNVMADKLLLARAQEEEARVAAEDANQAKSIFLANMSHELRTPMNAIIGYGEMLVEDAEDLGQDDFIPDLQKILGAGKHLLSLINDVLDLSKIEAGKMTLFLEDIQVTEMIGDITSTIDPLVAKNSNQLKIEMPAEPGILRIDETKVRQTLFNLLSNACKFTDQGTITLRVRRFSKAEQERVTFEVVDTGIGMTAEQSEKVFDEFTQADASTTRKFGGTGLGLSISKKFCQLMGGDIRVTSQMGVGTTFTVELPAVVDGTSEAATTVMKTPKPKTSVVDPAADPTAIADPVLVIDDDPAALDLTRRCLTREGLQVITANNGQEGLQLARAHAPRAIILDVMMPRMDGWSVLTELKKDAQLEKIPVIMLSMIDEKEMGFALGASEYLNKPVDRERLGNVVRGFTGDESAGRVLLIEDEADTRLLLRRRFAKDGWEVDEAANGKEGLERIAAHSPDLILLDLTMPEMDGFEFLDILRTGKRGANIPVVVLTARSLELEERQRLEGKVDAILQKGAQPRDSLMANLKRQVDECLARAKD